MAHAPGHQGERIGNALLWFYCILIFIFLLAPILIVIPLSFSTSTFFSYPMPGWSLQWYEAFFASPGWRNAVYNSLIVGVGTTVISTPIGILAALGLRLSRAGYSRWLFGLFVAPMVVPVIITACGLYFFLARVGMINTLPGLIVGHVIISVPFVVIMVTTALNSLDPTLPRAAANLGASPTRAFFDITLPLILPGILAAIVLAFVSSFDDVIVVSFIAGADQTTMPKELWKGIRDETSPLVLSVSTVMVAVSTIVLAIVEISRRKTALAKRPQARKTWRE